jgi:SAM-dependent methyltransferase
MKKLNLGCGHFRKEGFINLDISNLCEPDVLHDLDNIPYPFKNNTFDLIESDHVLEHLSKPFEVMKELHRILKPAGILKVRVPHFSRAMSHPQHKSGFDITFPCYFNDQFSGGFTGVKFINKKLRLHWFAQKYLMKKILPMWLYIILSFIGFCLDLLAAISPMFCSRVWCFWVGGFYEIEFEFEKPERD